jgi:SAM-dependent methyltransferase
MQDYSNHFYDRVLDSRRSAREVVPLILEFIRPASVIDIGCGRGDWLSVFEEYGVESTLGMDGDWVDRSTLLIRKGRFLSRDLRTPFQLDETFDLVLSLEVAEHLPGSFAEKFVGSLTGLAPVVVFSAAIPFQEGTNHVNEQWPDYWASLFQKEGFLPIDCIRSRIWQNDNVSWWYAQNLIIFAARAYLKTNPALRKEYENNRHNQLSLVHPKLFVEKVKQSTLTNVGRKRLSELKRKVKGAASGMISVDRRKNSEELTYKESA